MDPLSRLAHAAVETKYGGADYVLGFPTGKERGEIHALLKESVDPEKYVALSARMCAKMLQCTVREDEQREIEEWERIAQALTQEMRDSDSEGTHPFIVAAARLCGIRLGDDDNPVADAVAEAGKEIGDTPFLSAEQSEEVSPSTTDSPTAT